MCREDALPSLFPRGVPRGDRLSEEHETCEGHTETRPARTPARPEPAWAGCTPAGLRTREQWAPAAPRGPGRRPVMAAGVCGSLSCLTRTLCSRGGCRSGWGRRCHPPRALPARMRRVRRGARSQRAAWQGRVSPRCPPTREAHASPALNQVLTSHLCDVRRKGESAGGVAGDAFPAWPRW